MEFEQRRQEQVAGLGYALAVATVVLCARAGLFPGAGEAHSLAHHPYRLSMAATGGLLAVFLGVATGWFGVRRRNRLAGLAALAGGGLVTGAALSFAPMVLYPADQYPVSFGWVVGGAPLAAVAWLVATVALGKQETFAPVRWRPAPALFGWSKALASGTYLVPLVLIPSGVLEAGDPLWRTAAPVGAAFCLAVAGGLLVWNGGQPLGERASSADGPWRAWHVRAAVVFGAYGLALLLAFVTEPRTGSLAPGLVLITGVLAVAVAVLRGPSVVRGERERQALPIRLLGQALVAGAGATVLLIRAFFGADHPAAAPSLLFLAVASAGFVVLEAMDALASAGGPLVAPDRRPWLGAGAAGSVAGIAAPWLGWLAAPVVLGGLLAYQHAREDPVNRHTPPSPPPPAGRPTPPE